MTPDDAHTSSYFRLPDILRCGGVKSMRRFAMVAVLLSCVPAYGSETATIDGKRVTYWPSSRGSNYTEFRFDMKGYRNTYLLDCQARRFLWTKNVRISTGKATTNTAGAEWRPLSEKSAIANTVYHALCPQLLAGRTSSGRTSEPGPSSASLSNPAQALLAAALDGDGSQIPTLVDSIKGGPKPDRGDRRKARALNERGLEALSNDNPNDAVADFTSAARADPRDVEVIGNLGYALLVAGRPREAKKALEQALSIAPDRAAAWANLGEAYSAMGEQENAVAAFRLTFRFSRNLEKTEEYITGLIDKPGSSATLKAAAVTALEKPYFENWAAQKERTRTAEMRGQLQEKARRNRLAAIASLAPNETNLLVWTADLSDPNSGAKHYSPVPVLELFNKINLDVWDAIDKETKRPFQSLPDKPVWRQPNLRSKGEFEKTKDYDAWKNEEIRKSKAQYEELLQHWVAKKKQAEAEKSGLLDARQKRFLEHLHTALQKQLGAPKLGIEYDADTEKFNISVTAPGLSDYTITGEHQTPIGDAPEVKKDILSSELNVLFTVEEERLVVRGVVMVGETQAYTVTEVELVVPDFAFTEEHAQEYRNLEKQREIEKKREQQRKLSLELEKKHVKEKKREKQLAERCNSILTSSGSTESTLNKVWDAYRNYPGNDIKALDVKGGIVQVGIVPSTALITSKKGHLPAYLACYDYVHVFEGLGDSEMNMCIYLIDNPTRGTHGIMWRGRRFIEQLESKMVEDEFIACPNP